MMNWEDKSYLAEKYKQAHPVPERLSPEQIEKLLKGSKKNGKSRTKKLAAIMTAAAACVAVSVGGLVYSGVLGGNQDQTHMGNEDENSGTTSTEGELVETALDYESIAVKIQLNAKIHDGLNFYSMGKAEMNAVEMTDDAAAEQETEKTTATEDTAQEHSETYLQEAGVDEADIIKTDGEQIYYIAGNTLYFLRAEDGNAELLTSKTLDGTPKELYLNQEKLYVVYGIAPEYSQTGTTGTAGTADAVCGTEGEEGSTEVLCYDVNNPEEPVQIGEYTQSGTYQDSRMKDGFFYLITDWANYSAEVDTQTPEEYIPAFSVNGEEALVAAEDIQIGAGAYQFSYTVVAGLDFSSETIQTSVKASAGETSAVYASADSIYILQNTYSQGLLSSGLPKTQILRYTYENGTLELAATGRVSGYVLNQYACSEYDGSFRIATTDYDTDYSEQNNLFVLNLQLKTIGKLENYGSGETIRSVNFQGNTAYVVTFEQTDPLFAIDLSEKENPTITDELKVTGYSSHLRSFGDGLLFGIGYEADANTGWTNGIKISMFTVDDSENLTESARKVFMDEDESCYYYSTAAYDANALLLDAEKNLIGFPLNKSMYYEDSNQQNQQMYMLYAYDQTQGFVKLAEISGGDWQAEFTRAVYIGNDLYAFCADGVVAMNLGNYKETARLAF